MPRDTASLRAASDRLDVILRELDAHADRRVGAGVREAVGLLLDLQGEGLARVLTLAADGALGGAALVSRLADDPFVGPLLVLHRVHPYAADVRVSRALERLRPQIAAHGCRATLVAVEDGRAHVRLEGSARLSDDGALARAVETHLLEAAPELTAVAVEDGRERVARAAPPLLQILRHPPAAAPAGTDR